MLHVFLDSWYWPGNINCKLNLYVENDILPSKRRVFLFNLRSSIFSIGVRKKTVQICYQLALIWIGPGILIYSEIMFYICRRSNSVIGYMYVNDIATTGDQPMLQLWKRVWQSRLFALPDSRERGKGHKQWLFNANRSAFIFYAFNCFLNILETFRLWKISDIHANSRLMIYR